MEVFRSATKALGKSGSSSNPFAQRSIAVERSVERLQKANRVSVTPGHTPLTTEPLISTQHSQRTQHAKHARLCSLALDP